MKSITSLLIIFGCTLMCFSQNYKFGKVQQMEVEEAHYPLDSSANAAILYKHESVNFDFIKGEGWQQTKKVHLRIKIYNKEGYDWATQEIYLYKGSRGNREKISNIKGYTFVLDQGKLKKIKLKSDGIFEEDYSEYREKCSITMPNIKEGAVIELSYKITSPFLDIDDIVFQHEIPVKKLETYVAIPQYLNYNEYFNPKASFYPDIIREKKKKTYISNDKQRNNDIYGANTSFSSNKTDYHDNVIGISEENIPAVKKEPYSGSLRKYIGLLTLELSAFVDDLGVIEKSFSSTWEDVSKTINESNNFGGQLARTSFFKNDIEVLVQETSDSFEKAAILYNYVKSKVKWNGYNGYSTMKGTKKAYQEGSGNISDINLLLTAMLRSQGVQANPVLISTRENGTPLFPTRKGFNYVVCLVEKDNEYVLLDASEPYATFNVLPERAINWKGRLIKSDGSSQWINLGSIGHSVESTMLNVDLSKDLSAKGKVRKSYSNQLALNSRHQFNNASKGDLVKKLESGKGSIEVSNIELKNKNKLFKPLQISYDYDLSDGVDAVGDKIYFSPMFFLAQNENPFKMDKRLYPIDFIYPFEEKFMINIKVPEGYNVEYLPKNEALAFNEGAAEFKYILKKNGSFLQLLVNLKINKTNITPSDYPVFKSFFSKIVEKQSEQIVLAKNQL